jgi:hypothetical protein
MKHVWRGSGSCGVASQRGRHVRTLGVSPQMKKPNRSNGEGKTLHPGGLRARNRTVYQGLASDVFPKLMSVHGQSVWTGRALQAESDDLEIVGLALLYPALEWNVCVPGHHGYPRARSHSRLGPEGHMGHLITNALARPFLHLLVPARRPRRESQLWLSGSARAVPSEPPSLARPIWRATGATGGGGHPLGEPERVHVRPLPL